MSAARARRHLNYDGKKKSSHLTMTASGGDKRDRTADLLNAIQALSQLSYTPIFGCAECCSLTARLYYHSAFDLSTPNLIFFALQSDRALRFRSALYGFSFSYRIIIGCFVCNHIIQCFMGTVTRKLIRPFQNSRYIPHVLCGGTYQPAEPPMRDTRDRSGTWRPVPR